MFHAPNTCAYFEDKLPAFERFGYSAIERRRVKYVDQYIGDGHYARLIIFCSEEGISTKLAKEV
jgi:hypothetical protein